jgi:hypothetical protein
MRKLLTRKRAGLAVVSAGAVVSLTLLTGCPGPLPPPGPPSGVGRQSGWCMSHNCWT